MTPAVSVIVRANNKAQTIEATFAALRAQTVPCEIIVVDSGSTDDTVAIARRGADQVLHIAPEDFSYGASLNLGASAARAEVHAALSAHCVPARDTWLADSIRFYEQDDVAATGWARLVPDGSRFIDGAYFQTVQDARDHPAWGFSNTGSTWRAAVWREIPFRGGDLFACDDREWSWRVLAAGHRIAYSPDLYVPMDHRRAAGPAAQWRRVRMESAAMRALGALPEPSLRATFREWWSPAQPLESRHPTALRRLSPMRTLELLAAYAGARSAPSISGPTVREIVGS